ncbi:MAG: CPCC family cysteine-rich protein [Methanobacterium sp.]
MEIKFQCPCCGNFSLLEKPPGTYEICPICNWEDDIVQYNDPDYSGGANKNSLNESRALYKKLHAKN